MSHPARTRPSRTTSRHPSSGDAGSQRRGNAPARSVSGSSSVRRAAATPAHHRSPRTAGPSSTRQSSSAAAWALQWNEIDQETFDPETLPSFAELGLPAPLADALQRSGVTRPFPIQAAVIADVLAGRDVLGRAATGAGKTLAFGLPMLSRLRGSKAVSRRPRAIVLVPTRELAMQVTEALTPLGQAVGLTVRLVAGGLAIGKQIANLERGVDVLVCTPGRLEDLIDRRACDLGSVEISVLDEADHMADLGFLPAVKRILGQTPGNGQRLLFSATLDGAIGTLVTTFLTDPAAHAVASATAQVDTMTHHVLRIGADDKLDVTARIGSRRGRTIMFVRTKHGADRLAKQLGRAGVAAGALHGGRSQAQRTRALDAFKDGSVPVLVATDVAARGIHVDDISLVLHVDPPAESKDYLHRSGRTARAGASGTVVVLATPDQERPIRKLLADASVDAAHHSVRSADEKLAVLTGAQQPSGIPVSVHSSTASRPAGSGRPAGRSGHSATAPHRTAGSRISRGAARSPQPVERRPSRRDPR